jgi:hypothetical protein
MASILPYSLGEDLARGNVDFDTHSFKIMLLTTSYSPSQAHDRRNDVEANEVSGTGYTAGGKDLTVASVIRTSGSTAVTFTTTTVWDAPVSGFTARYAAIYRATGGASSTDPLVAIIDAGAGYTANGQSFAVNITTPLTITVP